jgi:MarR family transcriptional regulator for hemolysin
MASHNKFELGQTLMLVLEDFQRRLDADLSERKVEGIRPQHRVVFMHLDRFGASRSVDLAAAAAIRPQSMMKIVHELEQLGLVTRRPDPTDSRAKLVEFTAAGQKLIAELTQSTETVWDQYAKQLGTRKLEQSLEAFNNLLVSNKRGEKT